MQKEGGLGCLFYCPKIKIDAKEFQTPRDIIEYCYAIEF
jgi:hypothetical protein